MEQISAFVAWVASSFGASLLTLGLFLTQGW